MNTPRSCTANNVVPRVIGNEYPQNCTANSVVLRFTGNEHPQNCTPNSGVLRFTGNEHPQNCTANSVVLGFNGKEYLQTYRVTGKQTIRKHIKLYIKLFQQQQNSTERNKSTKTPRLTNSYVPEDPEQVRVQYTYGRLHMYTHKGVQLKLTLKHTGTRSAAA